MDLAHLEGRSCSRGIASLEDEIHEFRMFSRDTSVAELTYRRGCARGNLAAAIICSSNEPKGIIVIFVFRREDDVLGPVQCGTKGNEKL